MNAQREEMQEIHLMPTNDCVEHEESHKCVCEPHHDGQNAWDLKEGIADKILWIHKCIWIERQ